MPGQITRFFAPAALFEWGAVLTYFYFSHRLASFLHPSFRPPVLVTGFLLLIAAACVLFSGKEADGACDCDGCEPARAKLSLGGALGFLVLLLPILLAAKVSPDSYGAVLIQNRGVAESLESVAGALARAQNPPPSSVYTGTDMPSESGPPDEKNLTADIPKGWVPPNAPEFSTSKNVPDPEYPSNAEIAKLLHGGRKGKALAVNERARIDTPFGDTLGDLLDKADSPLHEGGAGALKLTDGDPCLAVEVVDLLIAAQNPKLFQQLNGKRIELTGQVLGAEDGGGDFRIMRLLVLCCAADAQPLAVRVEPHGIPKPASMAWVKVSGKVTFARKGKAIVPVIAAEKVTPIPEPNEPFLY